METTVNISGMTCAHCVGSVTQELSATITSTTALDSERISDAVTDAGYHLVTREG